MAMILKSAINIGVDLALGKTTEGGLLYFFGIVADIPAATILELRGQWAFGPEFALGVVKPKFIGGALLFQKWDVESGPRKTSIFGGQYFYAILLKGGNVIGAGPTLSYNWDTKEFTFPIGTG